MMTFTSHTLLATVIVLAVFLSDTSAKKKVLKIVVPHKINYIHHHHTHVFVLKGGKGDKTGKGSGSGSKLSDHHHLHYIEESIKNPKKHHHYYVPSQPPHYDEEESNVMEYVVGQEEKDSYFPELFSSDSSPVEQYAEMSPYFNPSSITYGVPPANKSSRGREVTHRPTKRHRPITDMPLFKAFSAPTNVYGADYARGYMYGDTKFMLPTKTARIIIND